LLRLRGNPGECIHAPYLTSGGFAEDRGHFKR
jgi:hypothetical protein